MAMVRVPTDRMPTHPGEILLEEFLTPLNLTQRELATALSVPAVLASGAPIRVPVGEAVLGRMLNVFGEAIDGGPAPVAADHRPIHRPPPPLPERVLHGEVLETGIKAIDLLAPIERGGKIGLFGGAGVG
ncbi:MAG TPA: F0F1 ATP synthase subunit beta, partial [Anaerolineae bacterium]|nr:F0F1 ATP synthase subunit beta [Anaerolineae bacterium]